jgi:hypothetical protein
MILEVRFFIQDFKGQIGSEKKTLESLHSKKEKAVTKNRDGFFYGPRARLSPLLRRENH